MDSDSQFEWSSSATFSHVFVLVFVPTLWATQLEGTKDNLSFCFVYLNQFTKSKVIISLRRKGLLLVKENEKTFEGTIKETNNKPLYSKRHETSVNRMIFAHDGDSLYDK